MEFLLPGTLGGESFLVEHLDRRPLGQSPTGDRDIFHEGPQLKGGEVKGRPTGCEDDGVAEGAALTACRWKQRRERF